jgi:hypothetical protein
MIKGKKIMLMIEQMHSENGRAVEQRLDRLIESELKFENGSCLLSTVTKVSRKPLNTGSQYTRRSSVARWHKRKHVAAYLDEARGRPFTKPTVSGRQV